MTAIILFQKTSTSVQVCFHRQPEKLNSFHHSSCLPFNQSTVPFAMAAKRQRDSIFMIDDGSDDGEARSVTIDLDGEGELESVQDTNGEPRHKRQRSVAAKPLISGALRRNAAPAPAASSRPALASASTLAPAPTPAPILRNEPTDLTGSKSPIRHKMYKR